MPMPRPSTVFGCESLGPTQHDAVDHDQGNEDAEFEKQRVGKGLHHQFDDGHEGGDDDDEAGDPDLGGNHLSQHRDQDVGSHQHEGRCNPHPDPVLDGLGNGQGGAESKHQAKRRYFVPQTLGKFLYDCFGHCDPPCLFGKSLGFIGYLGF
jgi:hypothetical protein